MTNYMINDADTPKLEGSLYHLLGAMGAREVVRKTRPQRLALATKKGEVWVQPSGLLVCPHGHSRRMIYKLRGKGAVSKRKAPDPCGCTIHVPHRIGSVLIGQCGRAKLPLTASSRQ